VKGNFIAIGDSQGRIGIFDASETPDATADPYQFYEEVYLFFTMFHFPSYSTCKFSV
jgi:hypothetical protein